MALETVLSVMAGPAVVFGREKKALFGKDGRERPARRCVRRDDEEIDGQPTRTAHCLSSASSVKGNSEVIVGKLRVIEVRLPSFLPSWVLASVGSPIAIVPLTDVFASWSLRLYKDAYILA